MVSCLCCLPRTLAHVVLVPHRQQDFPNLITDLNDVLNKLGFALKRSNDPVTGRPHLIFVNTRSDVLAQVATEYSPQEIMYFRMLVRPRALLLQSELMEHNGTQIEEIMTADDMKFAISTFEAMNLSKEVKPALKKTQAQTLLDSYVAKGDSSHLACMLSLMTPRLDTSKQ